LYRSTAVRGVDLIGGRDLIKVERKWRKERGRKSVAFFEFCVL